MGDLESETFEPGEFVRVRVLITKTKPTVKIFNCDRFTFECCDCKLVHNFTVSTSQLKNGTPFRLTITRNERATKRQRKK
jgi:hypothetical protein